MGGMKMMADTGGWDQDRRQSVNKGLKAIQMAADAWVARGRLNHERARHVADLLLKGKAIAIGFTEGAKQPVEIPAYLFDTDDFIKWDKNEIRGNGHRYISVKIVKLEKSERLRQTKRKPIITKVRAGRPAYDEIDLVINELKSSHEFLAEPHKLKAAQIEKVLKARYPDKYPDRWILARATSYRYLKKNKIPGF